MQQEKDRIRYGKELQAAKREEDSLALKRNLEARRIEKEEERKARDKIRVKLGAHRAVTPDLCRLWVSLCWDTARASRLERQHQRSALVHVTLSINERMHGSCGLLQILLCG